MASKAQSGMNEFLDGEEKVLLHQLWRQTNLSDRVYGLWFLGLTLALLAAPVRLPHWTSFLLLNLIIIETITLTAWRADHSRAWRITHDWYPMLLLIVAFEEIARLSLAFVSQWQDGVILRQEERIFVVPPTEWLAQFRHPLISEFLEFGYFSFYWMLPVVGIVLYAQGWKKDAPGQRPFRLWMDALAIGYVICFTFYLLFPTEGPAHTLGRPTSIVISGPFRWLVLLIQRYGGVHGNAFPSGHIMAAAISLFAALKWAPRLGRWLIVPFALMCIGAVYDAYHYASDAVAGALLGLIAFAIAVKLLGGGSHGVN
jgi:membrane-associated phospholipid phosphatase